MKNKNKIKKWNKYKIKLEVKSSCNNVGSKIYGWWVVGGCDDVIK